MFSLSKRSSEMGKIKLKTHYFLAYLICSARKFPGTPEKFQIFRDTDPETGNLILRDPELIYPETENLQTAMQNVLWWVFLKAERKNE